MTVGGYQIKSRHVLSHNLRVTKGVVEKNDCKRSHATKRVQAMESRGEFSYLTLSQESPTPSLQ